MDGEKKIFIKKIFIIFFSFGSSKESSRFTELNEAGEIVYSPNRPAIVVSSTSWSEDENFEVLFNALKSRMTIKRSSRLIEINRSFLLRVRIIWNGEITENRLHCHG